MAHDFKQKEPSKTERMLYELAVNQNQMEKGLWSTSTLVMVSAILNKLKPEEIAELMVNGDEKIKKFSTEINEHIQKLEAKKHEGHDHTKAGHDHKGGASEEIDTESK